MGLLEKRTIAGAVAREIERIDAHPACAISEGVARQAAIIAAGGSYWQMINESRCDYEAMESCVVGRLRGESLMRSAWL